jgi:hypothetical protein
MKSIPEPGGNGLYRKCSIHLDKIDDMLQRFAKAWPKGTPKPKLKAIKMRFAADKNL